MDEPKTLPAINARKKCNEGCQFFTSCPMVNFSKNDPENRCMMKVLSEKNPGYVTRFIRLYEDGDTGVLDEIRSALYIFGMKAALSDKLKDFRDYTDLLIRFYKVAYADAKEPVDDKEMKVVITEAEGRKVPVDVGGQVIDVPSKYVTTEDDPESLFYSPVVDEVAEKEP